MGQFVPFCQGRIQALAVEECNDKQQVCLICLKINKAYNKLHVHDPEWVKYENGVWHNVYRLNTYWCHMYNYIALLQWGAFAYFSLFAPNICPYILFDEIINLLNPDYTDDRAVIAVVHLCRDIANLLAMIMRYRRRCNNLKSNESWSIRPVTECQQAVIQLDT